MANDDSVFKTINDKGINSHPKGDQKNIQYGTAGFRDKAEVLDHVMYRMGVLAALRARVKDAVIGVMLTASHNPVDDNGVKLVDPMGEMLEQRWETIATKCANAGDDELSAVVKNIVDSESIDMSKKALIFVGRDTRPSSEKLRSAVIEGVEVAGGLVRDLGVVTTPQLHFVVVCHNTNEAYGKASVEGYYNKMAKAFRNVAGSQLANGNYLPEIVFDGANGVGSLAMRTLLPYLENTMEVRIVNDSSQPGDVLNSNCGADFVKTQQKVPKNLEKSSLERCCSVDGDADRIIYYYTDDQTNFRLLDGDKIAGLIALHFKELLNKANLQHLKLGVVQTAYANGNSTRYIEQHLGVPVACVPTGVKHLHHRALSFDVGVYFEANGHGTVVFSKEAEKAFEKDNDKHCKTLKHTMDLINQSVGDALSDLLLVESILHAKGWGVEDWDALYTDLPNLLRKVSVEDRNVITTQDAERKVVTPKGLQEAIDKTVAKYAQGRSFVRPSGTEDVVRVYAEAATKTEAHHLALDVSKLVHQMAGGVGQEPQ